MTTAYTSLLGFALPQTGDLSGTWGDVVNASITQLVEDSVAGVATTSVASGDWTLTTTGSGADNQARKAILIPTGSSGTTRNINAPKSSKAYFVINSSTGSVVVRGGPTSPTTGVTITAGSRAVVAWDGSDFVSISSGGSVSTVSVTTANGFTGTVANPTTTPAITIATNVTGILKGNGTSISAATEGTEYLSYTSTTIGYGIPMNVTGTMVTGPVAFQGYYPFSAGYVARAMVWSGTRGESFLWGYYNSKPALYPDSDNYMDLGANGTFNYSWKNIYLNNAPVITSDKREKTYISPCIGLEFINRLSPVVYKWNVGGYIKDESETAKVDNGVGGDESPKLIPVPGVRHHYGLFAQDVKQAMDDSNITDFGGWVSSDINDPDAKQLLRYEEFIAPLIKAVQELSARLEILENR